MAKLTNTQLGYVKEWASDSGKFNAKRRAATKRRQRQRRQTKVPF